MNFQSSRPRSLGRNALLWFSRLAMSVLPMLFAFSARAQNAVQTYPVATGEPLSKLFQVSVGNQPSPVYLATVGTPIPPKMNLEQTGQASFTSFDFSGTEQVTVIYAKPVQKAKILPTSSGIIPSVSGNQVTFAISQPAQLTLEVNGDWSGSLHLFANAFEAKAPNPTDPNVIYYGPGIHQVSPMRVRSGQTVYLAEGAILYASPATVGPLFSLSGSNIVLRGRGIIDGSQMPWHAGSLLYVYGSNIQVEGVTLRDSSNWTFHILASQNVQVSNVKVLGWRLNADGIDIDSSQNVTLGNSFFRAYDDLVAIKTNNSTGAATTNVQVTQCVLWNQVAHALTVGSELRGPVQNVSFSDSDIIHDKGRNWLLAVYNGDAGVIRNITWDDLRIEQAQRLLSLSIIELANSKDADRGRIANIVFRDIAAPTPARSGPNLTLEGYDSNHTVNGVLLDTVTVGGTSVRLSDVQQNQYVEGVRVTP